MEDILHSITEISLPSALVGKNMQNNIMVFVHPWLLVFYAYVLAEKVEGTARVLTLNDIRVRFNLHCQIATHFYSTVNGTIYYLDEQGTVNRLSME